MEEVVALKVEDFHIVHQVEGRMDWQPLLNTWFVILVEMPIQISVKIYDVKSFTNDIEF